MIERAQVCRSARPATVGWRYRVVVQCCGGRSIGGLRRSRPTLRQTGTIGSHPTAGCIDVGLVIGDARGHGVFSGIDRSHRCPVRDRMARPSGRADPGRNTLRSRAIRASPNRRFRRAVGLGLRPRRVPSSLPWRHSQQVRPLDAPDPCGFAIPVRVGHGCIAGCFLRRVRCPTATASGPSRSRVGRRRRGDRHALRARSPQLLSRGPTHAGCSTAARPRARRSRPQRWSATRRTRSGRQWWCRRRTAP
jgi:hypothetical protein